MTSKFLRGFIDGSLSTLGIVIGASSGLPSIIIAAAVGGTLANGISNMLSAISATRAEQYKELRDVEKAMVGKELKDSEPDRRIGKQTIIAGGVDGLATMIGGGIPIIPYLFLTGLQAILISTGLVVLAVFLIGIYLGKLSRKNILLSALKMTFFAVVVAAVVYLIQSFIIR
jgi:predicted membrane protein (TIGR00267 family)